MLAGEDKPSISSKAFLRSVRNVRKGILTRSKIIMMLSEKACTVDQLAEEIKLSKSSVRRHLRNMLAEGIVDKMKYHGKTLWKLSGYGQMTIEEAMS